MYQTDTIYYLNLTTMKIKHYLLAGLLFSYTTLFAQNNQLSEIEKKDGWVLLFDGKTTNGWHLYNNPGKMSAWKVSNGELFCDPTEYEKDRGDLLTDKEYENYDFQFEWKISEGGNSGIFFNVLERADIPTAWASGPEYQLLEKSHADQAKPKSRAGCLYGFSAQINPAEERPAGAWNQGRIKQINGKLEFYLNGALTAQQDLASDEWKAKVAASGFKVFPEFGKYTKGKIALQDWAKGITFRNIKIKTL